MEGEQGQAGAPSPQLDQLEGAIEGLRTLLEQSQNLGMSRRVRLRLVAIFGELQAAADTLRHPRFPASPTSPPSG